MNLEFVRDSLRSKEAQTAPLITQFGGRLDSCTRVERKAASERKRAPPLEPSQSARQAELPLVEFPPPQQQQNALLT
ncbi:hypothetical protein PC116_g8827 [Phytophthora cactorum]|uniref:Uncharacterized protein n=1 Tax=Phytophthora cactorum TaxID=29920 RepID=A0A8T0ZKB2_9STRA|nr:hypothetical protein Pcac1_g27972 [Phytophthora cactorum]KAG2803761.1 hypothetical protein PC112_g19028 [Phytophthora cactorum]KAG2837106.1 hypothetical protein PC111_g4748 [Phytophthora cactorum]KAG2862672.1 hypothetical protein PC113_g6080 [Phytophthora cactorum]KAG2907874.1 hypothetical protein PC117_g20092 [Phytophthora cactorum]